jgi:hypothetical protein
MRYSGEVTQRGYTTKVTIPAGNTVRDLFKAENRKKLENRRFHCPNSEVDSRVKAPMGLDTPVSMNGWLIRIE